MEMVKNANGRQHLTIHDLNVNVWDIWPEGLVNQGHCYEPRSLDKYDGREGIIIEITFIIYNWGICIKYIHIWFNSLWLGDTMWSWILVNIGSGNGLLPDYTKPLPDPKLTYISKIFWILSQYISSSDGLAIDHNIYFSQGKKCGEKKFSLQYLTVKC